MAEQSPLENFREVQRLAEKPPRTTTIDEDQLKALLDSHAGALKVLALINATTENETYIQQILRQTAKFAIATENFRFLMDKMKKGQ